MILLLAPRFPRSHFPLGFPANILYAFLIPPMYTTCPAPLIHFDVITLIVSLEESSLCNYTEPPVTSLHLSPNKGIWIKKKPAFNRPAWSVEVDGIRSIAYYSSDGLTSPNLNSFTTQY
jgi:hypothetical protein